MSFEVVFSIDRESWEYRALVSIGFLVGAMFWSGNVLMSVLTRLFDNLMICEFDGGLLERLISLHGTSFLTF